MDTRKVKVKVNYSIDEQVIKDFAKLAKTKAVNRSALVERLLIKWIEKNKTKDNDTIHL